MTESYRLTFNKPAVAQLLQTDTGETADGLKVRIQDQSAQFLPVRGSRDSDVLKLEDRSRGGVEAVVEGSMAEDLAKALKNSHGPFHTLRRVGGGWVEATQHSRAEAPSKFTPHVRVWDSDFVARPKDKKKNKAVRARAAVSIPTTAAAPTAAPLSITEMFERLRQAKNILERFGSEKRRGQPPREVREAREALTAFKRQALDFIPEVSEAHSLLHGVVSGDAGAKVHKAQVAHAAPEPGETLAQTPTKAAPRRRKSPRKVTSKQRSAAKSETVATA